MIEDEEDRTKRLAREKEEHQLHKLSKLAHSLKMDVHELKTMEEDSKKARQELKLGHKAKDIVWRRRGLMKYEIDKMITVMNFQRLIRRETIMTIDLKTNMMCREGAISLAACLRDSKTLTSLDISENSIGDEGAVAMAKILHAESCLTRLDLGLNKIGLDGVTALAEGLTHTTALRCLGLSFNQLCHSGIRPLALVSFGPLEVSINTPIRKYLIKETQILLAFFFFTLSPCYSGT